MKNRLTKKSSPWLSIFPLANDYRTESHELRAD